MFFLCKVGHVCGILLFFFTFYRGASYTALLRCLGPEHACILLYCILTEQKILIHSLRPALLTSVGEALTSVDDILFYLWQCFLIFLQYHIIFFKGRAHLYGNQGILIFRLLYLFL